MAKWFNSIELNPRYLLEWKLPESMVSCLLVWNAPESLVGPLDQMIAAHALSENTVLVTNNTREFQRVEGVMLENWAT
ncbi:MAG: hypothetical protein CL919_01460 [Deltaproteobacteria bacterium]|nr:hypothetical protein [Deltaproteobacteria bacterium]